MIRLDVPGTPAPKGSSRALLRGGRAINVPSGSDANKHRLASWKSEMLMAIHRNDPDRLARPTALPIVCACVFRFPMRKGDLGTGKNAATPKPNAPAYLTGKPDCDKLMRSTLDSVTASGSVWLDDGQAIILGARVYVPPGSPVLSTILLGVDRYEIIGAWSTLLTEAEAAVHDAKEAKRPRGEKERAA